ncbi:luciferin 4-monooxygenase [Anabrus simplex]|uniref:luciferin 4-monooxygenase n=1 Tax=Anabrus simplex TaxID=316456 RepID=UPI0034DD5E94
MAGEDRFILRGPPAVDLEFSSLGEHFMKKLSEHGNKISQIDAVTNEQQTFLDISIKSQNLAACLRSRGIKPQDVIGVCSENNLNFCLPVLASLYLGAICAPYNPSYTPRELRHAMDLSPPRIIFCSEYSESSIAEVLENYHAKVEVIVMGESTQYQRHILMKELCDLSQKNIRFQPYVAPNPKEDVALVLNSSGTTGLPKGVMLTHHNVLNSIAVLEHPDIMINRNLETVIGYLPFFHSFGISGLLQTLHRGITMIVMSAFAPDLFLQVIQDYKIRMCLMVPPIIAFLAKHPMVSQYDLSSLETIACGAAPLSRELHEEFLKRFPGVDIRQGYGLTETALAVLVIPMKGNKHGSSGKVVPGTEAKVIDLETGKPLGPYQEGELCFRGCMIMKGYANNREATAETIDSQGWLHTGDIGYYDNDGYFFIIDRLKELIKYKGFQVAPAELEGLLMSHPAVQDAAVIGVPDDNAGELPRAFVVKKKDVTEEELIAYIEKQVSPHKRLRGGVEFVEEIPKNPSGKILRRELRRKVKSKL